MADPRVYVQFDQVNWTDITDYVEKVEINRGRSYELDQYEAGTCTLTLNNEDGRFTPGRKQVGGVWTHPYEGNVKPRRRVKVVHRKADTTEVPMFTGSIERWPAQVDLGTSSVNVPCVDGFSRFASNEYARPLVATGTAGTPQRFYPLNDGEDAAQAVSIGTQAVSADKRYSEYGGVVDFGYESPLSPRGDVNGGGFEVDAIDTVTSIRHATHGGWMRIPFGDANEWRMGDRTAVTFLYQPIWLETTDLTFGNAAMIYCDNRPHASTDNPSSWTTLTSQWTNRVLWISWTNANGYRLNFTTSGAGGFSNVSPAGFFAMNDVLAVSIVGELNTGYGTGKTVTITVANLTKGTTWTAANVNEGPNRTGAVFFGGFPTTPIAPGSSSVLGGNTWGRSHSAVYSNLRIGWAQDFNTTQWSDTLAKLDGAKTWTVPEYLSYVASMDPLNPTITTKGNLTETKLYGPDWDDDTTELDLFRNVAEQAGGAFYMNASDQPIYETRYYRLDQTVSLTFDDDATLTVEPGLLFESDEDRIINDVTVTRTDGSAFRATDPDSIDEYGTKTKNLELSIVSDLECQDAANWLTFTRGEPLVRCDQVSVNATVYPAYADTLCAVEVSQRIKLDSLPGTAPYEAEEFFIEGINHSLERQGEKVLHNVQLQLSPAGYVSGFILDSDTNGLLDSDAAVLVY